MSTSPIRETQILRGPLLITHAMPEAQSVALGIFLDVGSRDEGDAQAGIAHALEHMLFKGTQTHDVHALSELLDFLGGTANAFTARERTCFYMRVLPEDWKQAMSVLCDMVLAPTLPEDEWRREREVIFSEMAMTEDVPEDWIFDRHVSALYPGQSLGRPVLGNREALASMESDALMNFLSGYYRPPRMLVAMAGCVRHEEALSCLEDMSWPRAQASLRRETPGMESGAQLLERDDEQGHFICSFPGIAAASEERPVAWLANQMLGGGMSSCLFREVREKRGLAYGIGSQLSSLSDTGAWTISGGADPGRLGECVRVIQGVLDSFVAELAPPALARARRQLEIALRMGMDSAEANMLHLGARFDEKDIRPQCAWVDDVQHVSLEQLKHWVQRHLSAGCLWTVSGTAKALESLPAL